MAKSVATLGFEHKGIASALKLARMQVPPNQREYSWTAEHIEDLFQDIANAIQSNKSHYFLGTIVLTSRPVPEVVDGQQRLATTTILLAAIRDFLIERDEDLLYHSIENDFLFTVDREVREKVPRLTLNLDDKRYFLDRVLRRPNEPERIAAAAPLATKKASHKRISEACQLAQQRVQVIIRGHSDVHHIDRINQWLDFLETRASVILLTVPDELNAYVMFETLNDRGLKTSQADLLKNYLFGESAEKLPEAQHLWSRMTSALEPLDSDDAVITYLRHLTSALYGATREKEIFEKLHAKVSGRHQAIAFLESLAVFAEDYAAVLNPTHHKKWNEYPVPVREYLSVLRELRVVQIRPLLLAVAREFAPKEAAVAFRAFVSWVVRFLIAGGGGGGVLDKAYATAAKQVIDEEVTTTEEIYSALAAYIPTDERFRTAFETATVSQAYLARYYLRALEACHRSESDTPELVPVQNTEVLNLEHILPRSPTLEQWPSIDIEAASVYARRLGNMALLRAQKNSIVGNGSYPEKQPILAASTLTLTKMAGECDDWGVEEIKDRQATLAGLAVRTWPLGVK